MTGVGEPQTDAAKAKMGIRLKTSIAVMSEGVGILRERAKAFKSRDEKVNHGRKKCRGLSSKVFFSGPFICFLDKVFQNEKT